MSTPLYLNISDFGFVSVLVLLQDVLGCYCYRHLIAGEGIFDERIGRLL